MTVSIAETLDGAIATSGSAVVTITTALVPTDRLVVMVVKSSTAGTPSVSGLGTWTTLQAGTSSLDHYLFTTTGVTGGGNITISVGSAAGDYVALVLRSTVSASVTVHGSAKFDTIPAANTATQAADITAALTGMAVFASAGATGGTLTFPHATALPSSGWTTGRTGTNSNSKFIYQVLAADTTVRVPASISSIASLALLVGVFTDGDSGAPPALTSTFVGWGNPIF